MEEAYFSRDKIRDIKQSFRARASEGIRRASIDDLLENLKREIRQLASNGWTASEIAEEFLKNGVEVPLSRLERYTRRYQGN